MNMLTKAVCFWLGFLLVAPVVYSEVFSAEKVLNTHIKNIRLVDERVFVGGQPNQAQIQQLQLAGIKTIINLRPESELDWSESQIVQALGIRYISIPVAGSSGITLENAKQLQSALNEVKGQASYIHCASGNRVGGLITVIEAKLNNKPIEQAVLEGRRWGLTRLEPMVRKKLSDETL